jgi:hypothetical protein
VPDAPTSALSPGFYWVRIDGLPPEVARRDAEAGEWLLIDSESAIPDGHPAKVVVLSGPLRRPDMPGAPVEAIRDRHPGRRPRRPGCCTASSQPRDGGQGAVLRHPELGQQPRVGPRRHP